MNALRGAVAGLVLIAMTGCSHFRVCSPYEGAREASPGAASAGEGRLVVREGIAFAEVGGTPEEIGAQIGALFKDEMRVLVASCLDSIVGPEERARALEIEPFIPEDHRRELRAMASASGVSYEDLVCANTAADTFCSVAAAWGQATGGGPLVCARNMDFFPASMLGPATVVLRVRPAGKRAFVSVGWPGFNAVSSGMNADGVCGMVLINGGAVGGSAVAGMPVGYRIREALEGAGSRAAAIATYTGAPVASGHYVVFCDAQDARTVFQAPGGADAGFVEVQPDRDTLTCTNGAPDPTTSLQSDIRARCLADLLQRTRGRIDRSTLRRTIGATYLPIINAQAMLFEPATRTLQLALGTTFVAACKARWVDVNLAGWLGGGSIDALAPVTLPRDLLFGHFTTNHYPSAALDDRLTRARANPGAHARRIPAVGDAQP